MRSASRSGADPAHSRRRRMSRPWVNESRASTARPRNAAKPAKAPICSIAWTKVAARGYSLATTVAASPPGEAISSTTRSAKLASSPARTRCSSEFSVDSTHSGSIALPPHRPVDPPRRRRLQLLARGEELLVQLLAGPRLGELDRDVRLGLVAGEPDHVVGEVDDLHRLAHVEDEDLALAGADVAGSDHQLHRLGDRHEVARHLRVGDGDRAAALDLAAEDRHDAAGGGEDVAEADRGEARLRVLRRRRPRRSTRPSPSRRPSPSAG